MSCQRAALVLLLGICACTDRPLGLAGTLSGTVLIDGVQPAVGATVGLPSLERSAVADLDGRFVFAAVPLGRAQLVITASATRESAKVVEYQLESESAPLVISLHGVARLSGTVRDASGSPIRGAHVTTTHDGSATLTGSDGSYALDASLGAASLVVAANGFAPVQTPPLTLAWQQPQHLDVTLDREAAVSRVVGTIVRVGATDHAGTFVRIPGTLHSGLTDASGRFELNNVSDGIYSLAFSYGDSRDQLDNVVVSAGQLYALSNPLTPLGTLELVPGLLIGRESSITRLNDMLIALRSDNGYRVVDRQGTLRFAGDHALDAGAWRSPNGTHLYDEGPPSADGQRRGRLIALDKGTSTDAGPLAYPLAWVDESTVVATRWSTSGARQTFVVRIDDAGNEVALLTKSTESLTLCPTTDGTTSVLFAITPSQTERFRLSDGALLDSQPGAPGQVACNRDVALVLPSSGTWRAYYPDGVAVDTSIQYINPTGLQITSPPSVLIGFERLFSFRLRTSLPLPTTAPFMASPRGHWLWKTEGGLTVYRVDEAGLITVFAAADATSGSKVLVSQSEQSIAWITVNSEGASVLGWADVSGSSAPIDCMSCEPILVQDDGVVLRSGFGPSQTLHRFATSNLQVAQLDLPALSLPAGTWIDRNADASILIASTLDELTLFVDARTGEAAAIGHRIYPFSTWIGARTTVVQRQGPQAGAYLVEMP